MKYSRISRFLATILVVTLLIQILPAQAFATQEQEPVEAEQAETAIVGEIESLRSEQTKHFKLSDGSNIAVSYGRTIHYQDQNGTWIDIDNRPVMTSDANDEGAYQISNGTISNLFASTLEEGELFTSMNSGTSITTYLLDTTSALYITGMASMDSISEVQHQSSSSEEPHLEFDRDTSAELTSETTTYLEADSAAPWQTSEILPENLQSSILYEDVYPGVDIQYTLIGYDVKEDIIIRQAQSIYRYDFLLRLNGLTAVQNEDGSVSLYDEDLYQLYHIPVPYMTDAAGEVSYDVSYELTEIDEEVVLSVIADETWIEEEGRSFPVIIDPTLKAEVKREYISENADIYAVYVKESQPDLKPGLLEYLYTGCSAASDGMEFETYLYVNNLPTIPAGCIVTDAALKLVMYEYSSAGCASMPIGVYEVTGANPRADENYYKWFAEMSWNTKPTYSEENVIDFVTLSTELNECYISWDITKVVKDWYRNSSPHRVLALGAVLDHYNSSSSAAQSYAACGRYNTPLLVVSYRSNTGIEPYYTYQTMSVGNAGGAYVSDVSGQLKVVTPLVGYASSVSPFSLNAVYNSDYFAGGYSVDYSPATALGLTMSMGSGWTLDCIQGLVPETIESVEYLKYYDGDGTVHYFRRSYEDYHYYDEDGLGLEIRLKQSSNQKYEMTDDYGNTWYFEEGLLVSTKDSNNNVYTINYEAEKLDSIIQNNVGETSIMVASFDYNPDDTLKEITDAAGNKILFGYTGSDLTSVTYGTTQIAQYGYSSHRIQEMKDSISGYMLNFTYNGEGKISHFEEQAGNNEEQEDNLTGAKVDVSYSNGKTTYLSYGLDRQANTPDDIYTHYLFDHAGHTVNVYTTDALGNVLGASNAAYNPNSSTSRLNNHIDRTGSIGVAAIQLIRNSSLEGEDTTPWTLSGGQVNTEFARTGLKSFRGTDGASASYSLTLAASTAYTFSGYVKVPAADSGVTLEVTDSTGAALSSDSVNYVTTMNQEDPWARISVTFTTAGQGTYTLKVKCSGASYVYADDFQLETGEAPSSYNLLDNGSMEMAPIGWTLGTGASVDTASGVSNSGSSIKMVGNPMSTATNAYQDIPLNLPSTETYVLSGWAMADAAPDTVTTADDAAQDLNKQFGLRAILTYTDNTTEYHYVPFNPELTDWQFVSCVIVPNPKDENGNPVVKTVKSIRIICAYETNVNVARFDNISLVREITQTMKYDDKGNLVSATTSGLNVDVNTYDGGNLIQTVTGSQGIFQYTYDNTFKHRLMSVTQKDSSTEEGHQNNWITQSMSYDSFGNVISTTLSGPEVLPMSTSAQYTADGNRLTSITDASGATVIYGYNNEQGTLDLNSVMWGMPTSVTAPNNTVTTTAYDLFGRVMRISVAQLATLGYSYDKGNLKTITRTSIEVDAETNEEIEKTQTYHLAYDSFGKNTSISVGSSELAAYHYATQNGQLEVQEYENGHYVLFDYDSLGRTKTVTYTNVDPRPATVETEVADEVVPYTRTLSYVYNGEGQLHSVTETLNGVTTMYLYQYDTLGNLIGSEKREGGSPVMRTWHSYDNDNRLSAQGWQIGADSFTQTYSYDTWNGNLSAIVLSDNDSDTTDTTIGYTYDSLQRLYQVSNGVFTSTYDYYDDTAAGKSSPRLESIVHPGVNYSGKTVECNYEYGYDVNGNITSASFGIRNNTYVYDANNQLIRENNDRKQYTQTWEYDEFGNITRTQKYAYTIEDELGDPTSTVTYRYTNSNWRDLLTEYNGQSIEYDNIGNPLFVRDSENNVVKSYTWTQGRHMASHTTNGVTWTYTYDADGMRTGRTNGTNTYEYIYAGDKLVRMVRNGEIVDFGYAGGQLATMTYDGVTYYYVLNGQGDVVAVTDNTGKAVLAYYYSAYGVPYLLRADDTLTPILKSLNPFMYRGYVYDTETTLYYLQSRYYDPEMGRFINADAVVSTGQGVLGNNMFAYCGNNPVNYVDPTGEFGWWIIMPLIIIPLLSGCGNNEEDSEYPGQANCYAYALGLKTDPSTGKAFRSLPNPGLFADTPLKNGELFGDPTFKEQIIIEKISADAEILGYYFNEVSSADHQPAEGNWLIAVAIDPMNGGYHFFKRGSDGMWSHKPGASSVRYTDDSGKPITDPQFRSLDRYEYFVGYFEIGPTKGG